MNIKNSFAPLSGAPENYLAPSDQAGYKFIC
jgi:hypothetical protein